MFHRHHHHHHNNNSQHTAGCIPTTSSSSSSFSTDESNHSNHHKDVKAPMIPQQSVRRINSDDPTLQGSPHQGALPVAEIVTDLDNNPNNDQLMRPLLGNATTVQAQVVPINDDSADNNDDDNFSNPPSVHSFVTEEDQVANRHHLRPVHNTTITGDELLFRLKQHRKKATMRSGVIGGVIGMIFLGPLGALGVGAGTAIFTKHKLKRKEKSLRLQLQGRLNEPLRVFSSCSSPSSSPHPLCYQPQHHQNENQEPPQHEQQ